MRGACVIVALFFRAVFVSFPIPLVFRQTLGRNGVEAPRTKRIATQNAPHRQTESHKKATFLKCLQGIGRACRREPTTGISFQWGKKFLIKPYQGYANVLHDVFCVASQGVSCGMFSHSSSLEKAARSSRSTSVLFLPRMALRALMTMRKPVRRRGRSGS